MAGDPTVRPLPPRRPDGRARSDRPVRPLRRPVRARDAGPRLRRARGGLPRRLGRSRLPGRARRPAPRLRRSAVAAHRVPQPRRASSGCRLLLKREDLNHTGSPQDQQRAGPGAAGQAHGQDPHRGRDRRRPARRGHGHRRGPARAWSASSTWARSTWSARRSTCSACDCSAPRCGRPLSGSRTLKDAVNEAMRDWVATVETTHYCLGSVMGPHPYPWMVREFHRVHRRRGPGAVPGAARRRRPRRGGGLRRRWLERHRHLLRLRRHRRRAGRGRAGRRGGGGPRRARAWSTARCRYLMQDEFGQVQEAQSISAGLDYPGVGPEHAHLADIGRARYEAVTDDEVLDAFQLLSRTEGIIPALESAHALAWVGRGRAASCRARPSLLNLSGRGDKDVAQVAETCLGARVDGADQDRGERLTAGTLEAHLRARRDDGPQAAACPTSPAGSTRLDRPRRSGRRRRRGRRHRDRHPVLRPGDGRPHHPGGLASGRSTTGPTRSVDHRRGGRRPMRASRSSVMTYYNIVLPAWATSASPPSCAEAGHLRGDPARPAPRGGRRLGRGAPTRPASRPSCWPRPPAPDERLPRIVERARGLRLRRRPRWASPASGPSWRRSAVEMAGRLKAAHRQAGAHRRRRLDRRAGGRGLRSSPTAWSSARPSSDGCSRAARSNRPSTSSANCESHSTRSDVDRFGGD